MIVAGLKVDPLAIAALGFLVAVIVITAVLFAWVIGQMKKQRGEV
jgi:preprotein translocase subunit Sec61beta